MQSEIITIKNKLHINVRRWGIERHPTIVLLHGLGSTGGSFDEIASKLSNKFQVIALDLPGHGESSYLNDEDFFSMSSLADWVKEIISHYNLSDVHIAGHSVGGYIGLTFAKKYLVKSLILLDGGYIKESNIPGGSLEEEIKMAELHIKNYTFSSWAKYEEGLMNNGLSKKITELSKYSMEERDNRIKLIISSNVAKTIIKQKYYEPTKDTLSGVKTPVLLLRSTLPKEINDVRNSETKRLKQHLNISVIDIIDATHDLYWEQPEVIVRHMKNWITNLQ